MRLKITVALLVFPLVTAYACTTATCNPSISYAMGKQRSVFSVRLGNMVRSVTSMAKETEIHNKLAIKEQHELMRLRERFNVSTSTNMAIRDTSEQLLKASYLSVDSEINKESKE